ncbi:MAG: FAD-dependent oxidoreductase [Actinomycetota bacterium]|jgi:2,4-dienoyl-CoA reductase-like NADH-dependent reductase (Old Yellow Enzyme family)|nr:FAD-dependent oxidoreductase [Actinomycetota bacterium]
MSNHRFPHLFEPLGIGAVTIKNRIVSPGHDTVMVEEGHVTDQLVAYHEARAAGGVGLIVMQAAGVHDTARYTSHVLMAADDSCIRGYEKVAEAVRPYGTKLFGQLFHPGREVMESQDGSAPVALAPSAVPNERFHVMPRAMSHQMIAEIVASYGRAARRLQRAGLDGVEVVASHGYLPSQFLNPRVNLRGDRYGGSFENRLRFLREVLAVIDAETAGDFVVGVRISADELDDEGLAAEDSLAACVALDAAGLVDYLSVTLGTSASLRGSDHIVPPMSEAVGYAVPYVARVKEKVSVPVFAAGRINQPQDAERVLAAGYADAVIMNRALICDPTMPQLAEEGRPEEIRACIACNQACIGHFHAGYPISCIQRPETGRERTYGRLRPASSPRTVMVVGGGPAGLKAAAVAARRGHRVTLYEKAPRVGGQVLLAERLPGREEFGGAAMNLQAEAVRAGAAIVTNTTVDLDVVRAERPEAVVVATGALPRRPQIEVLGEPRILDAWQVIQGAEVPRGKVVVSDWKADWIGAGVAVELARRGHEVVLCVNGYSAVQGLQQYVRDAHLISLERSHVQVVPLVRLFGADDDSVFLQHVLTKEAVIVEGVTSLVLAEGHVPVDSLLDELSAELSTSTEVVGVGDCLAPRSVEEAVLEGLEVGAAL